MRSLEWLKEEVRKDGAKYPTYHDERDDLIKKMCSMHDILGLIDQIEQPETLSQKWIDDHKVARISNLRKMTMGDVVPVDQLEGLFMEEVEQPEVTYQQALNKIAERHPLKPSDITWILDNHVASGGVEQPALPVVPEFVAEWIEKVKELDVHLLDAIIGRYHRVELDDWLMNKRDGVNRLNAETLVTAWNLGYTVEEKKYRVNDKDGIQILGRVTNIIDLLAKQTDVEVGDIISVGKFGLGMGWEGKLTEQEIKDYDERYWAFAVPVQDIER